MSMYERAISALQNEGAITVDQTIIVTCGGEMDACVLRRRGFSNVLITNLDERYGAGTGDFDWRRCDAEDLPFPDDSFDWGMVHAGLHHCRSPHRGLIELLRVCRSGVLVIEARDSLMVRLAVRLGLSPAYEIESVALGTGGLRNGPVPNFIYRWTESEVRKTVESAFPAELNDYRFFYGIELPSERMTMSSRAKRLVAGLLGIGARMLVALFPRQGNQFGFAIRKTGKVKPWIRDGALDAAYRLSFDPSRYESETREGSSDRVERPAAHKITA